MKTRGMPEELRQFRLRQIKQAITNYCNRGHYAFRSRQISRELPNYPTYRSATLGSYYFPFLVEEGFIVKYRQSKCILWRLNE